MKYIYNNRQKIAFFFIILLFVFKRVEKRNGYKTISIYF